MNQDIHILSFYDDILCEIAQWVQQNAASDSEMITATQQLHEAIAADSHDVPVAGLQSVLRALPAFRNAHPEKRTYLDHLKKYLDQALTKPPGA